MITPEEIYQREHFYKSSYTELRRIHGVSPSHTEMIMYMALILKENPIELSIALLKLDQEKEQHERANDIEFNARAVAPF